MSIQSSINSMIGTIAGGVRSVAFARKIGQEKAAKEQKAAANTSTKAGSSPQEAAAQTAAQSAANAIEAKKVQKRNFSEYLKKQPTSLGGTVGDLPPAMQKQIASQYTKSQRRTLMDRMDKEKQNGGNKPSNS